MLTYVRVTLTHGYTCSAEMSEEVQDRMLSIQKREANQFAELTEVLETELAYATAYYDTLLKLKENWPDASVSHDIVVSRCQLTPKSIS